MWGEYRVLAVVPARGGSKGVPRKNLRKVGGRSLIAWTAATVAELAWIDCAVLTTDDMEIAEEGRRCGLPVPFLRPPELASDTATGVATWKHAWLEAEAYFAERFALSVYLQPTTPLRSAEEVTRTLVTLVRGGFKAATTIARLPGHFVPEKILKLNQSGCLEFYVPEGERISNRQAAAAYYYRTGACYAAWRETVIEREQIVEQDCAGVLVEGLTINIDEPIDLELAERFATRQGVGE